MDPRREFVLAALGKLAIRPLNSDTDSVSNEFLRTAGLLRAASAQHRHWGKKNVAHTKRAHGTKAYLETLSWSYERQQPRSLAAWFSYAHERLIGQRGLRTTDAGVLIKATGSLRHISISWRDIDSELHELENKFAQSSNQEIRRISDAYYEILKIHPFDDGNGRLARAFITCSHQWLLPSTGIVDITAQMDHYADAYENILAMTDHGRAREAWHRMLKGFILSEHVFWRRWIAAVAQLCTMERSALWDRLGRAWNGLPARELFHCTDKGLYERAERLFIALGIEDYEAP